MPDLTIAVTVLITGFTVVFAVLVLLIGIIKLYGTIVYTAQQKSQQKKEAALKAIQEAVATETVNDAEKTEVHSQSAPQPTEQGVSPQVVAVIAAAVDAMYGEGSMKVKSIKRLPQSRPVWSTAGILDNTRPF